MNLLYISNKPDVQINDEKNKMLDKLYVFNEKLRDRYANISTRTGK